MKQFSIVLQSKNYREKILFQIQSTYGNSDKKNSDEKKVIRKLSCDVSEFFFSKFWNKLKNIYNLKIYIFGDEKNVCYECVEKLEL